MKGFHQPVLLKEVVKYLLIKPGEKYIDATVGGGGHAKAILKLKGRVLGIDCDPEAIEAARKNLSTACPTSWQLVQGKAMCRLVRGKVMCRLVHGNFARLKKIAQENDFFEVAGILFDLGVSAHQLETSRRGFSFNLDGPLDMRMDPSLKVTAADLVNGLNKGELEKLFSKLGEEPEARWIATVVCQAREMRRIETTKQLAEIIIQAKRQKGFQIHPATRCFQALRIAVNDELNNLKKALFQALTLLKPRGRLVVISFHSGEDRIVKRFLKEAKENNQMEILTVKPVRPSQEEKTQNPRSRSAKLRVGEKNEKEF